jgi:hypothetical protein
MLGIVRGPLRVTVKLETGAPVLDMEACQAWSGMLLTEAYAQSLALACGDHWRRDPKGGALYAIILQRPADAYRDRDETEGGA